MISVMKDLIDMDALRKIDKVIYMTGENEYWQFVLNGWHREFLNEGDHAPCSSGLRVPVARHAVGRGSISAMANATEQSR